MELFDGIDAPRLAGCPHQQEGHPGCAVLLVTEVEHGVEGAGDGHARQLARRRAQQRAQQPRGVVVQAQRKPGSS